MMIITIILGPLIQSGPVMAKRGSKNRSLEPSVSSRAYRTSWLPDGRVVFDAIY